MRWAQIRSGGKMHLVHEPGEKMLNGHVVLVGYFSAPLCGQRVDSNDPNGVMCDRYRMTCNVPLGHACKRCTRIARARR